MTTDIVVFLEARLAEDEATAGDKHDRYNCDLGALQLYGDCSCGYPARVLAEIAAKREIVRDYQIILANNAIEKANDGDEVKAAARDLIAKSLRMVLRRLAAPYADHPDYDPAWSIDG